MKIGLTATADGNVALITTIKEGNVDINSGPFPAITSDLASQVGVTETECLDANQNGENPAYWNTNAYVAKYSSFGNIIWEKTFPADDVAPENHPGDYKKQECLYNIVEGDDGSLVFVGNTSHNQDDYYITRLASNCKSQNWFEFTVNGGHFINNPGTEIIIDSTYFYNPPPGPSWPITNTFVFNGNLTIETGNEVVIDGVTIEFSEGDKVIVEPGAKLTLRNGAKLTSLSFCPSSMWQGVEVWGDNTLRQSPSNQGFLTMSNSTIENAVIGVAMVKRDGFDYDLDYTGGILQASNADFKNNVIAVDFHPYDNFYVNSSGQTVPLNNISRINNFSFEVDHINDSEYAYVFDPNNNDPNNELRSHICFVKLEGVRGLNIRGNDFVNNEPNAIGERRGKGILAWESDFDVREYCPLLAPNGNCTSTPTPNLFENLYYGVHVKQMGASDGIRIANSTFNSNKFGIYFEGASNFAEIYSNTFNIDENMTGTFANANGGIKLDNASGFKVEDNTFNSTSQTTGGNAGGILVENSSFLTSSEMYRNTFNDLDVSVQTAGNNNDLSVDCNSFNHIPGSIDWHNTEVNASSPGLISDQGACLTDPEAPQANEFIGTYDPSFSRQILNNPGNPDFDYSSYSDPSFLPNNAFVENVTIDDCISNIPDYDDVCPSKLPTQGGITILRDKLISVGGVIGGISGTIDAGDKAALINIIQTEPAHIVRNTLMDVSPYLSDDVLIALIQEPNTPDWVVDQVLSANAPLTTSVIKALIIDPKAYPDNLLRDQINASSPLADESLLVTLMERNPTVSDWVIKDVMLNNTPLRDPSLLAFLTKSAPSANYVVRDVLKVNTPLSDAVDAQFIANGYPNWVVNAIYSSTVVAGDPDNKVSPKSERQTLESQLNYYGKQETQIESAIVRHYILEDSTEQAIAFLEERGSVRASCALLPFYYRKRDGGKLGQHVGIVEQFANDRLAEDPDSRIGKEAQALCKFYETVYAIKTQPGGYTAITGAQVAIMEDYAARNIALAENFENVLEYIGKKEEDPALWYPVMVNGVPKNMEVSESEVEAAPIAEDPTVKIYPNPTNDIVTISYTIPNALGNIFVSIYNLMGQEMRTFEAKEANGAERFSTRDFNNGVYIVTIRDDKGVQHTGKLVVQH